MSLSFPPRVRRSATFLLCGAFALVACSSSESTSPSLPITVALLPVTVSVQAGATQQFTATVTNTTNTAVTWTASGGTITSAGLWTAPLTGGTYNIIATSVADPTVSATSSVLVTAISIAVSPLTANVGALGTQQYTATVTNSSNTAVTWTATGGTISAAGLWTAPVTAGTYTITATSVADPTRKATATATVAAVSVTLTPATQTLYRGEPLTLTATLTGSAQTAVTYSATCGTVVVGATALTANYTAAVTPGTCTVTATSTADPTKSASATLTIRKDLRVATFDDVNNGSCTFAHCSLREAIVAANASADLDTIRLITPVSGVRAGRSNLLAETVITLTSALPVLTTPIAIVGPGVDLLSINANSATATPRRALAFQGSITGSVSGLTVRNGLVIGDGVNSTGGGGIALISGANVALTDVVITGNEARNALGGGLWLDVASKATLLRVAVESNKVTGTTSSGGGIDIDANAVLNMTGGRINSNTIALGQGAGISVYKATAIMDGVTINGNQSPGAGSFGGGISVTGIGSAATLGNLTVTNNSVAGDGGGMYLYGGVFALTNDVVSNNSSALGAGIESGDATVTATGMTISGNIASQRGGGVFLFGAGINTFATSTISNNSAQTLGGGGVYLQNTVNLTLTTVNITGNHALSSGNGGGIFAGGGIKLTMTNGSLATNDVASGNGGGLYAFTNTVTMTGVTVNNNKVMSNGPGGGLALYDGVTANISGGAIRDNNAIAGAGGGIFSRANTLALSNLAMTGNNANIQGGALQLLGANTVTMIGVTMTGNSSAGSGGAIGLFDNGNLTISGGSISTNTSGATGGAIAQADASVLSVTGTTISNNTSQSQGGGIQSGGTGTLALQRVTVAGNKATAGAGGGMTLGTVTTIDNSTISGNTSAGTGGGIFAASTSNVTVRSSTISGNTGAIGGGVGATGTALLNNVTVIGNNSNDGGGGIAANFAGKITATNSLFANNLKGATAANCGLASTVTTGSIVGTGYNMNPDATCPFNMATDKNGVGPGVSATLANNGGSTLTHALVVGSAAIDGGNPATCTTTDQRGAPRAGVCDIGAFELGGVVPALFAPSLKAPAVKATMPSKIQAPTSANAKGSAFVPDQTKLRSTSTSIETRLIQH